MQTLLLPLHTKYSLFRAGCKKPPISKAEHVFHGTLSLSVPVQELCKSCKAWGQHASPSSWHRFQEMRNTSGLQCVFISPTHIFSLLRRCYEWLCSWECPMWVCAVFHTPKPTRGGECFPCALLASVWLICCQCPQRQGSLSYSAESLKNLFKKQLRYFLHVHLAMTAGVFLCFILQYVFTKLSLLPHAILETAVSQPTLRGRTLLHVIHNSSTSTIHFALLAAIISMENRNGGKKNNSWSIIT